MVEDRQVTLLEAHQLLGIRPSTLGGWSASGKILPVGGVPYRRHVFLYRLSDIEACRAALADRKRDLDARRNAREEYKAGRRARKGLGSNVCRSGLEPDPADGLSGDRCREVEATRGLLTVSDYVELARRKAKLESGRVA